MSEPPTFVPRQRDRTPPAADVAPVEQAKGMLMLCCRIGEHQAAALLERWSGEWDVPLSTVAATILATATTSPVDVGNGVPRGA